MLIVKARCGRERHRLRRIFAFEIRDSDGILGTVRILRVQREDQLEGVFLYVEFRLGGSHRANSQNSDTF
jgi:hypothetical protein